MNFFWPPLLLLWSINIKIGGIEELTTTASHFNCVDWGSKTKNGEWPTNGALDYGYRNSCVDPKSGGPKICNDWWDATTGGIGVVSHHLRLILGVIESTICVHLYAK